MSDLETEIENLERELDKVNPINLLTSNEIFDAIQVFDSTV